MDSRRYIILSETLKIFKFLVGGTFIIEKKKYIDKLLTELLQNA